MEQTKVILASTSATRIKMLRNAGLEFASHAAELNEGQLQESNAHLSPAALPLELAKAKALSLAPQYPDAFLIGSDQVLDFQGRPLHKARTIGDARTKLKALRGHTHQLHSAVAVVHKGKVAFAHTQSVTLTMRLFSDEFLENYLAQAEYACLHSAGCYHYESLGAQLFEKVDGDYCAILGLPLLPLLAFLRQSSILPA